jgi:XTP/dITP diphosphohydrolase
MIVVAATQNQHKIKEIESITKAYGLHIISRQAAGIPAIEIEEDGDTFEENSLKKAMEIKKMCGQMAIADDSGLMVDILGGSPGVISARFAGVNASDQDNNEKLLELLKDVADQDRTGRFVSVITLVYPDGKTIVARGECPGHILHEPKGQGGFGYDPLFVPDGFDKTFAELSEEEKNQISHRALALQKLSQQLDCDLK